MTPAIETARKQKIVYRLHRYSHDVCNTSWGCEAAEKLDVPAEQVFKTLVVKLDNGALAVAVVPVSSMLSLKRLAKAAGVKKAVIASPAEVERSTGYILGGSARSVNESNS